MSLPRRSDQPRRPGWLDPLAPLSPLAFDWPTLPPSAAAIAPRRVDWKAWLRAVERKRRQLARRAERSKAGGRPQRIGGADGADPLQPLGVEDRQYLALVTRVSFEMDGIALAEHELTDALATSAARKPCRSRQAQRLRNHIAILRRIGSLVRRCQPLDPRAVVRWYTSISCGLSSERLDESSLSRLTRAVQQINSPHLNLRPALEEISGLYLDLLADPIVPSFNGILARLLLGCHLGRCGLPPVLFDPRRDRTRPDSAASLLPRLLEMVQESYDALLSVCRGNGAT